MAGLVHFFVLNVRTPHIAITDKKANYSLEEYAHFLYCKYKYRNSQLYTATLRGQADKLGWSTTKTKKYISRFKKLGWVVVKNGMTYFLKLPDIFNYTLEEAIKFLDKKKAKIYKDLKIDCGTCSYKEILRRLRFVQLQNKRNQTEYITSLKDDYRTKCATPTKGIFSVMKKLKKAGVDKNKIGKVVDKRFKISYYGAGKNWGVSKSTAFNYMKDLIVNGFVIKRNNVKKICYVGKVSGDWTKYTDPSNTKKKTKPKSKFGSYFFVNHEGVLVQRLPNDYLLQDEAAFRLVQNKKNLSTNALR